MPLISLINEMNTQLSSLSLNEHSLALSVLVKAAAVKIAKPHQAKELRLLRTVASVLLPKISPHTLGKSSLNGERGARFGGFVSIHGYCSGESYWMMMSVVAQVPTKAQMVWSVLAANELCTPA